MLLLFPRTKSQYYTGVVRPGLSCHSLSFQQSNFAHCVSSFRHEMAHCLASTLFEAHVWPSLPAEPTFQGCEHSAFFSIGSSGDSVRESFSTLSYSYFVRRSCT